jgi:hypothetical protein
LRGTAEAPPTCVAISQHDHAAAAGVIAPIIEKWSPSETAERLELLLGSAESGRCPWLQGSVGDPHCRRRSEVARRPDCERLPAQSHSGRSAASARASQSAALQPRDQRIARGPRLLAGRRDSDAREGGTINRQGECLYKGEAHTYRVALLEFREQNCFNLVDLLRCGGPPRERFPSRSSSTASRLPFALPPGRRVALNVGANEKHRRWPAEILRGSPRDCALVGWCQS